MTPHFQIPNALLAGFIRNLVATASNLNTEIFSSYGKVNIPKYGL